MFFNADMSDGIEVGRKMISKSGEIAEIVQCRYDAPMCLTIVVKADHFGLEIRSATVFNEMFSKWKWMIK